MAHSTARALCLIAIFAAGAASPAGAAPAKAKQRNKAAERVETAAIVLRAGLSSFDKGIPRELLHRADCVGVFPSVWKGAFLIGGKYGKGVVSCRKPGQGWSAPAAFRIEGGNIGFQIGGSSTDVILLFLGERSVEKLLRTKFTIGVDASAAAGPVGREVSGAADLLLGAEILSYSRSRGLFAGIALDGAALRPAHKEDRKLYGWAPRTKEILRGDIEPPPAAERLLRLLKQYSPEKRISD